MPLLWAFLAAALCDSVPAFLPPAWAALLVVRYNFPAPMPLVVAAGVAGSTAGRLLLSLYIRRVAHRLLNRHEERNIEYLGGRLGKSPLADNVFVALYCITPLSTTPLFLAAAISRVSRWCVFPGFVAGKLVGYAIILSAGARAAGDVAGLLHGRVTWTGVLTPAATIATVGLMLFIDWKALLQGNRLRLDLAALRVRRRA